MKKYILFILLISVSYTLFGQSIPTTISYQAILRNNAKELIPNQRVQIEFKISKLNGGTNPTLNEIYKEIIPVTSDSLGIINVEIGTGVPTSNKIYADINWADNLVYSVVITQGSTILAKSDELLRFSSVPYSNLAQRALKADTAKVALQVLGNSFSSEWQKSNDSTIYTTKKFVGVGIALPKEKIHLSKGNMFIEDGLIDVYKYEPSNQAALRILKHSNLSYPNQTAFEVIGGVTDQPNTTQKKFKVFTDGNDPFNLKAQFDGYFTVNEGKLSVYNYNDLGIFPSVTITKHSNLTYPNQTAFKVVGGVTDVKAKAFSVYTSDGDPYTLKAKMQGNMIIEEGHLNVSGNVDVGGDGSFKVVIIRGGSDIIEEVYNTEGVKAGEVVVIDPTRLNYVKRSQKAYDKTVVGVVSGAQGVNHGIKLAQKGVLDGNTNFAIAGRVYVKVTGKVEIGDLLTTSNVAGCAMAVEDPLKSIGTTIGKALSLPNTEGMVLMLVMMR